MPGHLSDPDSSRNRLFELWYWVLFQYSKTQLSVPNEDKIVAVQGVSKHIADALNDTLFFGFLASAMPQSLCWCFAEQDLSEHVENQASPAWHFAHLNKQIYVPYPQDHEREAKRPLLALFHNSKVDPMLHAVPEFLGCVARMVSLAVKLEYDNRTSSRLHDLNLSQSTQHCSDQHPWIYTSTTGSDPKTLFLSLDHRCQQSDLAKTSWVLLPVSLKCSFRGLQRTGRPVSESRELDDSGLRCIDLFLQRRQNGDLIRKGVFYCDGGREDPNFMFVAGSNRESTAKVRRTRMREGPYMRMNDTLLL
jgi:hypothetical protein